MAKSARDAGLHPADKALRNMNYRDLKIGCIVRGMPFEEVVEAYHGTLASYFRLHYVDDHDPELLEDFDVWMDKQLENDGLKSDDPLRTFKLSSVIDPETQDIKLRARKARKAGVRVPKAKRLKQEKNKNLGVRKGTKKEYTMELVKKLHDAGKNLESKKLLSKLIDRVMDKYPDANEKSIKIWFSRARREINANSKDKK
jgi:hypothetical protein